MAENTSSRAPSADAYLRLAADLRELLADSPVCGRAVLNPKTKKPAWIPGPPDAAQVASLAGGWVVENIELFDFDPRVKVAVALALGDPQMYGVSPSSTAGQYYALDEKVRAWDATMNVLLPDLAKRWHNSKKRDKGGRVLGRMAAWVYAIEPVARMLETQAAAVVEAPPADRGEVKAPAPAVALPACRHSPDFRSVEWYGQKYPFTKSQAACVRVLWEARENGLPERDGVAVLDEIDASQTRLLEVFRSKTGMHRAWGTMIVKGQTKGTYRLADAPEAAKPRNRKKTQARGKPPKNP